MCDSSENREDLLPQKAFIGLACRAGTEGFKERIICLLLSCELNIECKKGKEIFLHLNDSNRGY